MTSLLLLIFLAAAVLVGILLFLKARQGAAKEEDWPFYSKKPLTEPEQVLYHRLCKALPECIVLAQVQASRILGVKKGNNFGTWNNRVSQLSLDYVVCLPDATVVAAIELDDSTHERQRRKEADQRKGKALDAAGIPLIRWSVGKLPSEIEIQRTFNGDSKTPCQK